MGLLDDTSIFTAIIQQGGFSHAAKYLGLSKGLISRRMTQLEKQLGVTLIKRTTRQIHLTPEGELFWQHAQRIQQELDAALSLIQSSAKKPSGLIRISAPLYFGRQYLTPILMKFLANFPDIKIDLILSNQRVDPLKEQFDLVLRGAGYLEESTLKDSTLQMKLLFKEKIALYASPEYLIKQGEPKTMQDLTKHGTIYFADNKKTSSTIAWHYLDHGKKQTVQLKPIFNCNDIESSLIACIHGYGIGKFTELNARNAVQQHQLKPIMTAYDWGTYHLYAVYPQQQTLPKRTRLLLEFIYAHTRNFSAEVS